MIRRMRVSDRHVRSRVAALAALIAVAASSQPLAAASGSVLATKEQLAGEALALRVLASAPMRRQIEVLEETYRQDAQGSTPAGGATIRRAADSVAAAAAYYAVIDDADRPVFLWIGNAPHRWFGIEAPRAGFGIENPDNVYRETTVDSGARYEIRGRVRHPGPAELHFVVMDSIPGTTPVSVEGGQILTTLRSDGMKIAPDGSFTVTVDRDPAGGRSNHLQLPREGKYPLLVRDLLTDWTTQKPVALEIRRVAGPALARPRTEAEVARRAAELLSLIGPYWVAYDNRFVYSKPRNQVAAPRHRPGGRGFSSSGHFELGSDGALVVTVDPLGARSLGFQLTDPWGVALEYIGRTSSLNNAQAAANPDGTITFVVTASDPGVYNWLDTDALGSGMFAIRWQALPEGTSGERAVRDARVVKRTQLEEALPAGTRFVTPAQRRAQQAARARGYARRLE